MCLNDMHNLPGKQVAAFSKHLMLKKLFPERLFVELFLLV
jgi:hypothetical protein